MEQNNSICQFKALTEAVHIHYRHEDKLGAEKENHSIQFPDIFCTCHIYSQKSNWKIPKKFRLM